MPSTAENCARQASSAPDVALLELRNNSGLQVQCRQNGSVFAIRYGSILINQVLPFPVEDGLMRLGCRIHNGDRKLAFPVIGAQALIAGSRYDNRSLAWRGETGCIYHEVTLVMHASLPRWLWRLRVVNIGSERVQLDALYGQDLGLAEADAVHSNEAYVSQYIDHYPIAKPVIGTGILSRQNQLQGEASNPWIAQISPQAISYCTDGYQFYGSDHRLTAIPAAWSVDLPSIRKQYEFAYVGLQTTRYDMDPGDEKIINFFARFEPHHPKVTASVDAEPLLEELIDLSNWESLSKVVKWDDAPPSGRSLFTTDPVLPGEELGVAQMKKLFPEPWRNAEYGTGKLLSFFHGTDRHVVTRAKEALVDRPHGQLLKSGTSFWPDTGILGSTVFASGIFNSQVYLGNSNISRFLSPVRNPLNILRACGQRVFVQYKGVWRQLGIPSAFEMSVGYVRWLYKLQKTTIEARVRCFEESAAVSLELRVLSGAPIAFLVSHALAFGANELDVSGQLTVDSDNALIRCSRGAADDADDSENPITWTIEFGPKNGLDALGGDELLYEDGESRSGPFAVFQTYPTEYCTLVISATRGKIGDRLTAQIAGDAGQFHPSEKFEYQSAVLPLGDLRLSHAGRDDVGRLSEIIPWFAQNAMMHLSALHGLEQYSGAAWGTRDVCQGPVEWLLAARRYSEVRRILLYVFSRQYLESGGWPQWFMHAPFEKIQQVNSHGDVLFWPVKALCDYIEASNDFSILEESVSYTDMRSLEKSPKNETIVKHVDRVIAHFESRLIPGTMLVNYGDGDWDDTLQPADRTLRSSMVSAWTVGLAYHAFRLWKGICHRSDQMVRAEIMESLLRAVERDFRKHLIIDEVVAGFAIFENGTPRPLLHPRDRVTNIRYRLLPMTRSVLAGLFSPAEARKHACIIREFLLCPDGVRLMSEPVPYAGGAEKIFRRAETASNFGREIGLQYVHAHIRYAETMARLGDADALWKALLSVNPVGIEHTVPNAVTRQSNTYFSSSDGNFSDRYEAGLRFADLRIGNVPVKGGWRIYSSGPGLYLNTVFSCLLGWRESFGDIVIDPVIPHFLDGLNAEFTRKNKIIKVVYRVRRRSHTPVSVCINGVRFENLRFEENPHRTGGVRIKGGEFESAINLNTNLVEIEL